MPREFNREWSPSTPRRSIAIKMLEMYPEIDRAKMQRMVREAIKKSPQKRGYDKAITNECYLYIDEMIKHFDTIGKNI